MTVNVHHWPNFHSSWIICLHLVSYVGMVTFHILICIKAYYKIFFPHYKPIIVYLVLVSDFKNNNK